MPRSIIALILAGVLIGAEFGVSSIAAAIPQNTSQSATTHGVTVYYGVVPAEIARGIARTHGETNLHGTERATPIGYHLIVALFNAVTGQRISNATVTASMARPGPQSSPKLLEPMKIADTTTYGNFFELPEHGIYRIHLNITRKGSARPVTVDFLYDFEPRA